MITPDPVHDKEESADLADAVFQLIRCLINDMGITAGQAIVICRAAERTMHMTAERGDFSLEMAGEAVELELIRMLHAAPTKEGRPH